MEPIRVALFEDNRHLRESLEILIGGTNGFVFTGAFPDCSQLLKAIPALKPDVVLMDIEMPGVNGIEATTILKEKFPEVQVLIQTIFYDDSNIFKAICAGASGYILKSTSPAEYMTAIREVKEGGSPMTPSIARRVVELFKHNMQVPDNEKYVLTDKEKLILEQLVAGKSYKMMAAELSISVETIKTHMKNIYTKLHVNSNTEAVAKALRYRILN